MRDEGCAPHLPFPGDPCGGCEIAQDSEPARRAPAACPLCGLRNRSKVRHSLCPGLSGASAAPGYTCVPHGRRCRGGDPAASTPYIVMRTMVQNCAAVSSPSELPSSIPAGVVGASSTAGARRVSLCCWEPSLLQCSCPLAPLAGQRELVAAGTGWVPAGGRGSFRSCRLTCSRPAAGGGLSWMHIAGYQPGGSSSGSSEPMLRRASSHRGPERHHPRLHPTAALPGCVLGGCARSSGQDAKLLEASVWSGGCTELSS